LEVYRAVNKLLRARGNIIRVKFSVGNKLYEAYVPDDQYWVAIKDILLNREYEYIPLFTIEKLKGFTIIDIGAHVGLYSLVVSSFASKVVSIELALKTGGFDEDIVFYEEATLPIKKEKLGYNVRARIDSRILYHEEGFLLMKLLREKYYYGKTTRVYIAIARYVEYGSMQISLLYRFGLFLKNRRFWSKPHLAFDVLLLELLGYLAAGLGCISQKLGV